MHCSNLLHHLAASNNRLDEPLSLDGQIEQLLKRDGSASPLFFSPLNEMRMQLSCLVREKKELFMGLQVSMPTSSYKVWEWLNLKLKFTKDYKTSLYLAINGTGLPYFFHHRKKITYTTYVLFPLRHDPTSSILPFLSITILLCLELGMKTNTYSNTSFFCLFSLFVNK